MLIVKKEKIGFGSYEYFFANCEARHAEDGAKSLFINMS